LATALLVAAVGACNVPSESGLAPIPDGLVVLTFDDGNKSDILFVAPKLVEYGFGASFYITEGLGYEDDPNKERYVSWEDVRQMHELGFEVGNHTGSHPNMTKLSKGEIRSNLELIEQRCEQHGIPRPETFVYPGWRHSLPVVEVLAERQYVFARRGVSPEYSDGGRGERGLPYDPAQDHPLLIPTTGYAGPDWGFEDLVWAIDQAKGGKIAVLTFHGVPAVEHPWVHTDPQDFVRYMDYLKERDCTVIAMRDLVRYVDPTGGPSDPYEPIRNRGEKAE
jgi:peptidoglycan/xylan/chitin deacetylase (PgdA/CDA1 family)